MLIIKKTFFISFFSLFLCFDKENTHIRYRKYQDLLLYQQYNDKDDVCFRYQTNQLVLYHVLRTDTDMYRLDQTLCQRDKDNYNHIMPFLYQIFVYVHHHTYTRRLLRIIRLGQIVQIDQEIIQHDK